MKLLAVRGDMYPFLGTDSSLTRTGFAWSLIINHLVDLFCILKSTGKQRNIQESTGVDVINNHESGSKTSVDFSSNRLCYEAETLGGHQVSLLSKQPLVYI